MSLASRLSSFILPTSSLLLVDPTGLKPAPHGLKGRRSVTRAPGQKIWLWRKDSNSRIEFGRLACFRLHHFRVFGVRRLVGALDIGVRIRIQFRKVIQSGDKSPHSKMELLAGLKPATSTFEASRSFDLSYRSRGIVDFRLPIAD